MSNLNATQRALIAQASPAAVQQTLSDLQGSFSNSRWVANNNRYRIYPARQIEDDLSAGAGIDEPALAQAISASCILHCADGWVYLGGALDALSKGYSDVARHLAYYAELRAAMSILCSQGIGIFQMQHFVVTAKNRCTRLQGASTHPMTWLVLEEWASGLAAANLLGTVVQPANIDLTSWLDSFGTGAATLQPIAAKWFTDWGIDIKMMWQDKTARNESSYSPNRMNNEASLSARDTSAFLCDFWSLWQPMLGSQFDLVDRELLRSCIRGTYNGVSRTSIDVAPKPFVAAASSMIGRLSPGFLSREQWIKLFTSPTGHAVIKEAEKRDVRGMISQHLQVTCRASLLLRMATGACSHLLTEAGFTFDDIKFWWETAAQDYGYWANGQSPTSMMDLWADIDDCTRELKTSKTNVDRKAWLNGDAKNILVLGQAQRIMLWGMAS